MEVSATGKDVNESDIMQSGINEQGATSLMSVSMQVNGSLGRYLERRRRKKPTRGTGDPSLTKIDSELTVKEDIVKVEVCKIEAKFEDDKFCERRNKRQSAVEFELTGTSVECENSLMNRQQQRYFGSFAAVGLTKIERNGN